MIGVPSSESKVGVLAPSMLSLSTMQRVTRSMEGSSYITSRSVLSTIYLRDLAPVFCVSAISAAASRACSVNSRSTLSMWKSYWYCLMMAFLGSVSTCIREFLSRDSNFVTTGSLPTISGIKPNSKRSSGIT